jgi:flagellar basal-body rod modification protein FlgD
MSTTPITSTSSTNTGTDASALTKLTGTKDPLTDKATFLQLLVAQLKNQDPLSPADGLQFVTQLAQFTGLEQSLEMNSSLKAIKDVLTATPAPTTSTDKTTGTSSTTTN